MHSRPWTTTPRLPLIGKTSHSHITIQANAAQIAAPPSSGYAASAWGVSETGGRCPKESP
jgi:hypothetical protein